MIVNQLVPGPLTLVLGLWGPLLPASLGAKRKGLLKAHLSALSTVPAHRSPPTPPAASHDRLRPQAPAGSPRLTPKARRPGNRGGEGTGGGFRRRSAQARAHSAQAPPRSDFSKKCLSSQSPELRASRLRWALRRPPSAALPGDPALVSSASASPLRLLPRACPFPPVLSQSRAGPGRAGPPGRGP